MQQSPFKYWIYWKWDLLWNWSNRTFTTHFLVRKQILFINLAYESCNEFHNLKNTQVTRKEKKLVAGSEYNTINGNKFTLLNRHLMNKSRVSRQWKTVIFIERCYFVYCELLKHIVKGNEQHILECSCTKCFDFLPLFTVEVEQVVLARLLQLYQL